MTKICVQYGCGLSAPSNWENFDSSPRLRFERIPIAGAVMRRAGRALFPANVRFGDIVKGLPIAPESVDCMYCSHVLEHIDRESVVKALNNTHSALKPGGVFRLVVPDLAWRARAYLSEHEAFRPDAADRFLRNSYLGKERVSRTPLARLRDMLGNSAHLWMYDECQMSALLNGVGFVEVRRCKFGDALDADFADVEDEGRFFDDGNEELAFEARKAHA